MAKLTETVNLTKTVNLVGENGKSGNLPWFGKCLNWMTKGAPWRKAILTKMTYVSGESG